MAQAYFGIEKLADWCFLVNSFGQSLELSGFNAPRMGLPFSPVHAWLLVIVNVSQDLQTVDSVRSVSSTASNHSRLKTLKTKCEIQLLIHTTPVQSHSPAMSKLYASKSPAVDSALVIGDSTLQPLQQCVPTCTLFLSLPLLTSATSPMKGLCLASGCTQRCAKWATRTTD